MHSLVLPDPWVFFQPCGRRTPRCDQTTLVAFNIFPSTALFSFTHGCFIVKPDDCVTLHLGRQLPKKDTERGFPWQRQELTRSMVLLHVARQSKVTPVAASCVLRVLMRTVADMMKRGKLARLSQFMASSMWSKMKNGVDSIAAKKLLNKIDERYCCKKLHSVKSVPPMR